MLCAALTITPSLAAQSAGINVTRHDTAPRGTVVLGNLSYPTRSLVEMALEVWEGRPATVDPRNRFMSGLPAQIVAEAIGAVPWVSAADLEFACKAGSAMVRPPEQRCVAW